MSEEAGDQGTGDPPACAVDAALARLLEALRFADAAVSGLARDLAAQGALDGHARRLDAAIEAHADATAAICAARRMLRVRARDGVAAPPNPRGRTPVRPSGG